MLCIVLTRTLFTWVSLEYGGLIRIFVLNKAPCIGNISGGEVVF